jgi:hypothetical protein
VLEQDATALLDVGREEHGRRTKAVRHDVREGDVGVSEAGSNHALRVGIANEAQRVGRNGVVRSVGEKSVERRKASRSQHPCAALPLSVGALRSGSGDWMETTTQKRTSTESVACAQECV